MGRGTSHSEDSWLPSLLPMDDDRRVNRLDSFSPGTTNRRQNPQWNCPRHRWCNPCPPLGSRRLQQVLAGFLQDEYQRRSEFLQNYLRVHMDQRWASFTPPTGGMFIRIQMHAKTHPHYGETSNSDLLLELFRECIKRNVMLAPGWQFSCKTKPKGVGLSQVDQVWFGDNATFMRATYASAALEELRLAAERFGAAVKEVFSPQ